MEVGMFVKCIWNNRYNKRYNDYSVYGDPAEEGDQGRITAIHTFKHDTIVVFEGTSGKRWSHIQSMFDLT